MLDLLLINGSYPDFEKGEIIKANIGIASGKITYIGNDTPEASSVVDVSGEIVSPGFIDIHMHEDDFAQEGEQYIISQMMLEMGVTTAVGGNCGLQKQSLSYFKEVIDKLGGAPVNYMMFTGYNSHRGNVGAVGRPTTKEERDEIKKIILKELDEGACGISFGVEYDTSIETEEMIYALEGIDNPDLLVSSHIREGCVDNISAVNEMFEMAEKSVMKFQISHLGSMCAMGLMDKVLERINSAAETDERISYDIYPYNAFSTFIGSAAFDDEYFAAWGMKYEDILLTDEPYKNMYCDEALYKKVREEYPDMLAVGFVMKDEEVNAAISNKYGMIASDAIIGNAKGHPRAAGTFPRLLGKYVREDKVLPLVDAIRKITLEPAKRLNLDSKGRIELGADADITIFNPDTIIDCATYSELLPPEGISHVYIGGSLALKNNETINNRLGRFIPHK
ncbi:MAG: amidohydrolase family protein [Firmicutes bacterium]|nr:amidohydrolase family protein [Bacillota bacterium]